MKNLFKSSLLMGYVLLASTGNSFASSSHQDDDLFQSVTVTNATMRTITIEQIAFLPENENPTRNLPFTRQSTTLEPDASETVTRQQAEVTNSENNVHQVFTLPATIRFFINRDGNLSDNVIDRNHIIDTPVITQPMVRYDILEETVNGRVRYSLDPVYENPVLFQRAILINKTGENIELSNIAYGFTGSGRPCRSSGGEFVNGMRLEGNWNYDPSRILSPDELVEVTSNTVIKKYVGALVLQKGMEMVWSIRSTGMTFVEMIKAPVEVSSPDMVFELVKENGEYKAIPIDPDDQETIFSLDDYND